MTRSERVARLGELTTLISSGSTPKGGSEIYLQEGPVMLIRSQNVRMNELALDEVAYVTDEIDAGMNRSRLQHGDVLLNITGASIGRVAAFELKGVRANVNQHVCIIRPKSDALFTRYATHLISSLEFQTEIERLQHGGTRQALTFGQIAEFKIPLPPLEEQRRIADVLDQAATLRSKRRAALAQLDLLTQSLFFDLFGDPRTNEKGWSKSPISSVISDMRGGAALEPDDFVASGFPILHKGAIKPDGGISIDPKKKTFAPLDFANANRRCQANREFTAVTLRDLVPSGPSIGLAVDLRNGPFDEYLLAQGAYAFRLNQAKVVPEYFVCLSNIPNFRHVLRQNAVGSTQIHIRTPIYLAITIPLPPLELQREFVRRMIAVQKLKAAQRASLSLLNALFSSLQYRAFKGAL